MSIETTRPDATVSNGDSTPSAGTRHGCLSDNSDSTYVDVTGSSPCRIGFAEPTVPAGAIVKQMTLRARSSQVSSSINADTYFELDPPDSSRVVAIYWDGAVTHAPIVVSYATAPVGVEAAIKMVTAGNQVRLYELYVDTLYVAQPTLTVDAPTDPQNTTNRPTVEWTAALDSDGGAQTHYEVRVFTDAQYGAGGFDPATSTATAESEETASAATSWQVPDSLADDTYRAYVRIAQTVNGAKHYSDWEYAEFEVDVPNPAVPTLAVVGEDANGRVRIDGTPDSGGGVSTHLIQFQHSLGGASWENVRTQLGDGEVLVAEATLLDYLRGLDDLGFLAELGNNYGAEDLSGNGNDAVPQNGLTVGGAASLIADDEAGSTDFTPGSNHHLRSNYDLIGLDGSWNGQDFTVFAMVDHDTATDRTIWSGGTIGTSNDTAHLMVRSGFGGADPDIYLGLATGSQTWNDVSDNDTPRFVVLRRDEAGNTVELLLDTDSQGELALDPTWHSAGGVSGFWIGGRPFGGFANPFDGRLSHVGVLERLMTDAEVTRAVELAALDPAEADLTLAEAYDYEAPNGTEVSYRARAIYEDESGERSWSAWSDTETASWEDTSNTGFWLKHPTDPSQNMKVKLRSLTGEGGVKREARQGSFQPLGDSEAVVISDARGPKQATATFRCDTASERDQLEALLNENVPLLLQLRPGDNEPDRWRAFGEHTRERLIDKAWVEGWWETYPWTEVARPEAPLVG